jgi:hypothetical protein
LTTNDPKTEEKFATYLQAVSQPFLDGSEVGALFRSAVPALYHDAIQLIWTVTGRLKAAATHHKIHHLFVGTASVRHIAK